tara:strand:+ start:957 stop:1103 length:147 start_codon:yes stop_codon:yes gene_type:complete
LRLGKILGFWEGNLRKIEVLVREIWKNQFVFGKSFGKMKIWENCNLGV